MLQRLTIVPVVALVWSAHAQQIADLPPPAKPDAHTKHGWSAKGIELGNGNVIRVSPNYGGFRHKAFELLVRDDFSRPLQVGSQEVAMATGYVTWPCKVDKKGKFLGPSGGPPSVKYVRARNAAQNMVPQGIRTQADQLARKQLMRDASDPKVMKLACSTIEYTEDVGKE